MKIAIHQCLPTNGDIEKAFVKLEGNLRTAATSGAQIVLFPELFLPGYNRPDLHKKLSQSQNGEWCDRLAKLANSYKCALVVGWAEREGDAVFNAATCFRNDGNIIAHHRKIQRFGPMEHKSFEAGNQYTIFDFFGHKTAILICYDIEFPQHVRALKEQDVTLVFVPTANPAGYEHVSKILVPARSSEMALTIAYANYCGSENGLGFAGYSLIVGPDGKQLVMSGTSEALLITTTTNDCNSEFLSSQLSDYRNLSQ